MEKVKKIVHNGMRLLVSQLRARLQRYREMTRVFMWCSAPTLRSVGGESNLKPRPNFEE
jgi:hypothetical protein